ncbi:hypothetical protein HanIR_Chr12g0569891 [Helianthus annuus]|nr:hypothetical protein HanIR_Chr12g0569891 [Helianthus annuus]
MVWSAKPLAGARREERGDPHHHHPFTRQPLSSPPHSVFVDKKNGRRIDDS